MADNILFLYDHRSDKGVLSGGSWQAGLPLTNLQKAEPYRLARSAGLAPSSTRVDIDMLVPHEARSVLFGPSNLSVGHGFRVTAWGDAAHTDLFHDSGWRQTSARAPWNTLNWSDPAFWTGFSEWEDLERGLWLVYLPDEIVTARYWSLEIEDQYNPDGYVEAAYLMLSRAWQPSINFAYQGNSLSFDDNSLRSPTLAGGETVWRRTNPRLLEFSFDNLPEEELFSKAYDFQRFVGFDERVFVIPDPADKANLQKRSMLCKARRLGGLEQSNWQRGSTAFEFREVI